jgi:hypothetical protein
VFCGKCGRELREGASFCSHCGSPAAPVPSGETLEGSGIDEIGIFVGKNAEFYRSKFRKFRVGGVETFSATWNWAACLCNFWWFLYRKLYLWALLWFLLTFLPFIGLAFWVAAGITGNYLYHLHATAKIREARAANPPERLPAALAELGGVNEWVIPVAIVIVGGFLLLAILFGVGIGLFPMFVKKSIGI